MTDAENDDTEDSTKSRPPGYVPNEGRTETRAPASPAQQFASFLHQRLGRTR
jgi:hypothetical protein